MPVSFPKLRGVWLAFVAILLAAAGAIALTFTGSLASAEDAFRGLNFALLDKPASGQVHVVEMDAATVAAIREWPWSRDHYARVVEQLDAAGVRSITFDVDFSSNSNLSGDEEFGAALRNARAPIVMPTFAQSENFYLGESLESLPIGVLREHVLLGSVSISPDSDGLIRRMPLGTMTGGVPRPSLSAHIAEKPGTVDASFPIDYSIDVETIPTHSFIAVERGAFDPGVLRDKDVLIGATAIEMGDRYTVPRNGVIPGVMVQALAAETLFEGTPAYGSWALPMVLAAGLAFFVFSARKRRSVFLRFGVSAAVIFGLGLYAQSSLNIWFEIVPATVLVLFTAALRLALLAREVMARRNRTDAETGLPNGHALRDSVVAGQHTYVIAGIFDNFDTLKAVIGRDKVGDLIARIVERLNVAGCEQPIYRTDDRVLSWCTSRDLSEVEDMLDGLRAIMRSPVEIGGRKVDVSLTFGAASAVSEEAIARAAHAASAALRGGEKWRLHDESKKALIEQEVSLMGELEAAIKDGHIKVYYQAKLDLRSNRVASAEALVRWEHPVRGMLPPDSFIPMAEENGRIEDLTLHMIRSTIADLKAWRDQGLGLSAAVNISARLLTSPSFCSSAATLVSGAGLEVGCLTFEVTESAELIDERGAVEALTNFRDMGVLISMDDYGTGHSTLSYLKTLPLAELKIDRSFVQNVHIDQGDAMLVRSTVQLAHALGLKVVAEGIEEAECLEFLRGLECDYAQGYFIARPMPAEQFLTFVKQDQARASEPLPGKSGQSGHRAAA